MEAMIVRAVYAKGEGNLGKELGWQTSKVSRVLSGEYGIKLKELERFLTALDLCVVRTSDESINITPEKYEALRLLAKESLDD